VYTGRLLELINEKGVTNVTLGSLSENSLLGQDEVQALIHLSREHRDKIAVIEFFDESSPITRNELYSIRDSNPDMLIIPL